MNPYVRKTAGRCLAGCSSNPVSTIFLPQHRTVPREHRTEL